MGGVSEEMRNNAEGRARRNDFEEKKRLEMEITRGPRSRQIGNCVADMRDPQAWHVQSAITDAISAGSSASYCIRPIVKTSSAKTAPAIGVPKTAPNPAAIPAISRIRTSARSSRNALPKALARLPPSGLRCLRDRRSRQPSASERWRRG